MPERSRIFWIEDSKDFVETYTFFIEMEGHTIVETASSLEEAMAKIPSLSEKGVNIVLVDGNLDDDLHFPGADGREIAKAIKNLYPEIIVIGNAGRVNIEGADFNSTKNEGYERLLETIKNA